MDAKRKTNKPTRKGEPVKITDPARLRMIETMIETITKTKPTTNSPDFVPVTFREFYAYKEKFSEWLKTTAGKQANAAFYGLLFLEIAARVGVTLDGEKDVARCRRALQKLLDYTFQPADD
jgi:hypothetical protein